MEYAPGSAHMVDIVIEFLTSELKEIDFGLLVQYLPSDKDCKLFT